MKTLIKVVISRLVAKAIENLEFATSLEHNRLFWQSRSMLLDRKLIMGHGSFGLGYIVLERKKEHLVVLYDPVLMALPKLSLT